ncbi:MAG: hypothetical protein JJT78_17855 [Leptospira sp.]|nr:hypothetical protein [Leptospira sp.]
MKILFLIPFLINYLLLAFTDYWGFPDSAKLHLYILNSIAFIWAFINLLDKNNLTLVNKISFLKDDFSSKNILKILPYIFGLQFLLFWIFPLQNMNYGDGILLLENVFIEGKIFGYQITLDEFWEAFLHSFFFAKLEMNDPRVIYRVFSSLSGFFYLGICLLLIIRSNNKYSEINLFQSLIFLAPGSILLFYGYSENYTIVSSILIFTILMGRYFIESGKSSTSIFLMAILAGLGASFHLVFGYMAFALIYFTVIQSPKEKFLKNACFATIIGGIYIGGLFGYFLFLSDPITSPSQTHVLSPPFYPWKRWISTNHFKEILGVTWFSSFFPFILLVSARILKKQELSNFMKQKENRFLLLTVFGFYVHAFFHNPSLGFPADWDLFSFYAFPMTILAFYILPIMKEYYRYLLPLLIYAIGFQLIIAIDLNSNPQELEADYQKTLEVSQEYVDQRKSTVLQMSPQKKKLFLKLDHFLFKANYFLQDIESPDLKKSSTKMVVEINQFKSNLEMNSFEKDGSYPKEWLKPYLTELTEFHHRLITIRKEDMKYRLEKQNSL